MPSKFIAVYWLKRTKVEDVEFQSQKHVLIYENCAGTVIESRERSKGNKKRGYYYLDEDIEVFSLDELKQLARL